ncbi:MAG: NACHT domain-containing protein [Symploca sp. SIO1B1]|nr:NACHT domain-containing protein [Symploca sp. SIO1C2]NER97109.1 NACHT domain-containing protein [Symploca sp. SIO1B1]
MMIPAAFWASFIPSLAAKLSSDLINAVLGELRGSIRRAIETGPEQAALQQAYESAFQACLPYMSPPREDLKDHYAELLYSFVKRQKVSEIFAELVDVRPGVNLDIPALEAAFKADYDTETLPEFNFSLVMQVFAKEYVSAVEHSKVLHHIVEVKHLKAIVANLEQLAEPVKDIADNTTVLPAIEKKLVELTDAVLSGKEDLNKLVQAIAAWLTHRDQVTLKNLFLVGQKLDLFLSTPGRHDTAEVTAIKDEVQQLREEVSRRAEQGLSTSELEQLEEIYRSEISACHSLLTFQGMLQNNQPVALPITDIFVSLSVAAAKPRISTPEEEQIRRQLEAADKFPQHSSLSAEQRETLLCRLEEIHQEPSPQSEEKSDITQALLKSKSQALVVLGDPGAGKTTLLRYLALAFAENHAAQRLDLAEQRLPIFVPLAAYNATLDNNHDFPLSEFLAYYYQTNRELPGLTPLFKKYLEQGQAIALFDGLDEVLDVSTRQLIAQRVQAFINRYLPLGNRIIMTSRVVGYQEVRLSKENVAHFRVLSLDETGIAKFIRAWSLAFEARIRGETLEQVSSETVREAKTKEQGLAEAIEAPSVKKLAGNPLLLTILAVVYRQEGLRLPRRRVELYDRYSRVLLETWNRVRSQSGRPVGKPLEFLSTAKVLSHLALWLQQNRPSGMARGREVQKQLCDYYLSRKGFSSPKAYLQSQKFDVGAKHLGDNLSMKPKMYSPNASPSGSFKTCPSPEEIDAVEQEAQQFLQDVREHSGLLIERGKDTYGFMHLTFQEYFTAWALAKMPLEERWQIISPHLHDSRWREVILLTAGQISVVDANEWEATAFLRKILEAGSRFNDLLQRDEILAAACLADEIEIAPDLSQIIVERIGQALRSPYPKVAKAAVEAMGNLQQTILTNLATAETIKGLTQPQAWKREIAVDTLAKLDSSPQRTQAVLSTLADSDDSVRISTVRALSQFQPMSEEVLGAIATRIKQEPEAGLRFELGLAVWQQKQREPNACRQLEESFIEAYLEILQPYSHTYRTSDLFKSLLEQLLTKDDTPTVQAEFLRLLFKSCQAYVQQLGLNFLEYLDLDISIAQPFWVQALNDSDWRMRGTALQKLFDLKEVPEELAAKVVDASQKEQHPELKELALGLSLEWEQLSANESDLNTLLSSSWWEVRQVAAQALGKLEQLSEATLTALVQGLSDSNSNVRRAIIDTLTTLAQRDETVVKKLRQALPLATGESQTYIFLTLVAALKQLDSNDKNYLCELLGDSDWWVRQKAAQTLGKLEQLSEAMLMALIQGSSDNNSNVRRAIRDTLTTLAQQDKTIVAKLCQVLSQATGQTRVNIILVLATLEKFDSNDESFLCELLESSNWQVRELAAQTLGKLEQLSEATLMALVQGLDESDSDVRQAIQDTLTALVQKETVVKKLRQALPQVTGWTQVNIILTLTALKQWDSTDENYLRELLRDSDEDVRQAAAQTLGKLDQLSKATLIALVQGLGDSDSDVQQAISGTLTTLAQRDEKIVVKLRQALSQTTGQSQTYIILILAAVEELDSEEVLSAIAKRMKQEPEARLRFQLSLALWQHKPRELTVCRQLEESFIEAYFETLQSYLPISIISRRLKSLLEQLLTKEDTPTTQAEFLRLLFSSSQTYVRQLGINLLTSLDLDSSIAQPLWVQALNDSDCRVQRIVLQSLFNLEEVPDQLVAEVVSFSQKEQHPEIKQLALGLSLKLGGLEQISEETVAALINCLSNKDFIVQQTNLEALITLVQQDETITAKLHQILPQATGRTRTYILLALATLEQLSSNDENLWCELLESSNWEVRQTAFEALGKLKQLSETMLTRLVKGLRDSDPDVKAAIRDALTSLAQQDGTVVTKLRQALPQSTRQTRTNILLTLATLKQSDSNDENLLCELLEHSDRQVQKSAAEALGKLEQLSEATLTTLVKRLSDSFPSVQQAIEQVLSKHKECLEPVIYAILATAFPTVRIQVVKLISDLGIPCSDRIQALLQNMLEARSSNLRRVAANTLLSFEIVNDEIINVLKSDLSHESGQINEQAYQNLIKISGVTPVG